MKIYLSTLTRTLSSAAMVAILTFFVSASVSGQDAGAWKKVDSPSEGFSVLMLGDVKRSELSGGDQKGFAHMSSPEGAGYSVITIESPGIDWKNPHSQNGFMAGLSRSSCEQLIASGVTCEIKQTSTAGFKKHPSRDFTMMINNKKMAVGRVVFVGPWVYTLMVMSVDIEANAADSKKFLESLVVVPLADGENKVK